MPLKERKDTSRINSSYWELAAFTVKGSWQFFIKQIIIGLCVRGRDLFETGSWSWELDQRSRADVLSEGLITWLRQIRQGRAGESEPGSEGEREKAGMSRAARSLFISCCQLKQAALHLHADARPALLASIHLSTRLTVQPALNEGLCADKGAWRVYSGTHTWQLGWTSPREIKDSCLSLSLCLSRIPYFLFFP